MTFLILFGIVAVAFVMLHTEMEAFKNAAHAKNENRENKFVEYLAYQDQYWGMIFGNPKNFSLYHKDLDQHIKKVRLCMCLALVLFFGFIAYVIFNFGL